MIQKKENNYNSNSWRRRDSAPDTNGGVGFDGSKYTSFIINKREDREYERLPEVERFGTGKMREFQISQ